MFVSPCQQRHSNKTLEETYVSVVGFAARLSLLRLAPKTLSVRNNIKQSTAILKIVSSRILYRTVQYTILLTSLLHTNNSIVGVEKERCTLIGPW